MYEFAKLIKLFFLISFLFFQNFQTIKLIPKKITLL